MTLSNKTVDAEIAYSIQFSIRHMMTQIRCRHDQVISDEKFGQLIRVMADYLDPKGSEEGKLQAIYDLEENISLSWFWDAGVEAKIGHERNGFEKEKNFDSVKDAIDWLYEETAGKVK